MTADIENKVDKLMIMLVLCDYYAIISGKLVESYSCDISIALSWFAKTTPRNYDARTYAQESWIFPVILISRAANHASLSRSFFFKTVLWNYCPHTEHIEDL